MPRSPRPRRVSHVLGGAQWAYQRAGVLPLVPLLLAVLVFALGACAAGGGPTGAVAGGARPTATPDTSSWRTVATLAGSATSQSAGGGTNSDQSAQTTSFTAGTPYAILAACQGTGALTLEIEPGPATTIQCAVSRLAPKRITGNDHPAGNEIVTVSIASYGQIEWWQVLAKVQP